MARSKYTKHLSDPDANPETSPDVSDDADDSNLVSRSAKKRHSDALKAFGMTLSQLSTKQLEELGMPQNLFAAIIDYQKITSNGARRRQRGYIGGLLRDMGDDVEQLRLRHTALTEHDADAKREHHALENWREKLLAEDTALTAFLDAFPQAQAQELRLLIRRARGAKNDKQKKIAERTLYRKLADIAQA